MYHTKNLSRRGVEFSASVNRQKQDLRDFMIGQDWEISIQNGSNPDNSQILKIPILMFLRRKPSAHDESISASSTNSDHSGGSVRSWLT